MKRVIKRRNLNFSHLIVNKIPEKVLFANIQIVIWNVNFQIHFQIYSIHQQRKIENWFFHFIFQALCGTRVEVPTLSGDRLFLNFNDEVIRPNTVRKIPGRGMPQPKDPTKRGDLVVSFEISFPEKLPVHTKDLLKNCLPNKWMVTIHPSPTPGPQTCIIIFIQNKVICHNSMCFGDKFCFIVSREDKTIEKLSIYVTMETNINVWFVKRLKSCQFMLRWRQA